jgi:glyoxylate carboligase
VTESTSNVTELLNVWAITAPGSYYSFAGGGLGWGAPAAVGVACAVKAQGVKRPVVAVIGDGAFQYSIQCLYTALSLKRRRTHQVSTFPVLIFQASPRFRLSGSRGEIKRRSQGSFRGGTGS